MQCGQFFILITLVLSYQVTMIHSQFHYKLPGVESEENDDDRTKTKQHVETADGGMEEAPRGIYHFSDTAQSIGSRFKVPDFEELDPLRMVSDLMGTALQIQNRRKALTGFELPLPFAGRPMNLQVSSDFTKGTSMADPSKKPAENKLSLNYEARQAFQNARQVCLSDAHVESCDEALDTYHRIKFGKSLLPSKSITDDPTTSLARLMVPNMDENLEKLNSRDDQSASNIHFSDNHDRKTDEETYDDE